MIKERNGMHVKTYVVSHERSTRKSVHSSGFFLNSICRYLNDVNYFGGLDQEDLNQLFLATSRLGFQALPLLPLGQT